jgi:hypothetical protein
MKILILKLNVQEDISINTSLNLTTFTSEELTDILSNAITCIDLLLSQNKEVINACYP